MFSIIIRPFELSTFRYQSRAKEKSWKNHTSVHTENYVRSKERKTDFLVPYYRPFVSIYLYSITPVRRKGRDIQTQIHSLIKRIDSRSTREFCTRVLVARVEEPASLRTREGRQSLQAISSFFGNFSIFSFRCTYWFSFLALQARVDSRLKNFYLLRIFLPTDLSKC